MAGTAKQVKITGVRESDLRNILIEFNKLVTDLETLRAAFVLHQHSALNAAPSTNTVAAAALLAGQLADAGTGTVIAS